MKAGLPWEGEHGLDPASLRRVAVPHDPARARHAPLAQRDVWDVPVLRADGSESTVAQVLARTMTDAWLVLHAGTVVSQWYRPGVSPDEPLLLMSISKTVVGMVAGCLVGAGCLHPADPVTRYVPELAVSGYRDATVRDVADMRSGVQFREAYTDPSSHIRAMDAAIAGHPGAAPGLQAYLTGLQADRPHGGFFEYRSCETDVLGWVCERASGIPMADLVAQLLWGPMGACWDAAFLSDWTGTPIYDGGMLACAADLGRFGEMLLDGGVVQSAQVIPRDWISQVWTVDPALRAAFADSAAGPFLPGGWYRNQCWVLPGPHGDVLLGLGIHGQLLRVDPATRTVIVKLSSWTAPQDPWLLQETLRACDAVAAAVSGRAGRTGPRFGPGQARLPPVSGR